MKRLVVLLLALLLLLTGCNGKVKVKDITVKDVCCPYKINHQKAAVEITLQDGANEGLLWDLETVPEDICQVSQQKGSKDHTYKYRITGTQEGVAQIQFTARQEDETVLFTLTFVVTVDDTGKVIVSDCRHSERVEASVEAEGMEYTWNMDTNGALNFAFFNSEDSWKVSGDGDGICELVNAMSTPNGCQFSAKAMAVGNTGVLLVGENTQRTICVTIQVDDSGKMEVISVQEQ